MFGTLRGRLRHAVVVLLAALFSMSSASLASADAGSPRGKEWYLDALKMEEAWSRSKGEGMTVAVIDSGVDSSLPELRGRLLRGRSFDERAPDPHEDSHGHGTTMAALVAGTGQSGGMRGLAPESRVLPVKWEMRDGMFSPGYEKAIDYAVDQGAKIINLSFGAPIYPGPEVQRAVDRANDRGALVFSSAGNTAVKGNEKSYPSDLPGVVSVGAVGPSGKVSDFSTYGGYVSLSAPGGDVAVRCPKNAGWCTGGGTSAASALASATAALIWSANPDWTANQVLRVMIDTAGRPTEGKVPSRYVGWGVIRPKVALTREDIDPGDPDKSPLFSKYYAKKKASESPTPESGEEPDDRATGDDLAADKSPKTGATNGDTASDGSSNTPLIAAGAGAALLFGAVATTVLLRRRRTS
ncbi:S8 family serine peptidase [Streptomyces durbertensis]|uniref:S8 family serine peptidase n=1 Tax=Streptomyces durbertensis TaxID=2448886 RepID=A0ABR6EGS8_9ACTN|nr:S8 family serine peptidase [Streptomyces durbertensis]MBB1244531.1 S8 family serine peptidase [Streptomyces durbertensis]